MKVLLLITGLGVGGAEKVVTGLADAFVEKGHEVIIAYLNGEADVLPSNPEIEVSCLGDKSIKGILKSFFRIRRIINSYKPDVVHSHMYHANIFICIVSIFLNIPYLVITAHNTRVGGTLKALLYRLFDRFADVSTNVSCEAVSSYENSFAVKKSRMVTVHNGIDVNEFKFSKLSRCEIRKELGLSENTKFLLTVGSLTEQKDHFNLFAALKEIDCKSKCIRLFLVGEGPLKAHLQVLAKDMGLEEYVKFLGIRRDVPCLMSASDVFVLSSAWEGFPLVVGEAMSCERVVVATDCGGVREFLGADGFLVPPKQPKDLADELGKVLSLSTLEVDALGKASRQRIINKFSHNMAVDNWIKLYTCSL